MDLDLNHVRLFVRVVDCGGFAATARALGQAKSGISARIAKLEEAVGTRLIQRSSRRFHMTSAGKEFYRHAKAMIVEAAAAESAVRQLQAEPSGSVTITSSSATLLAGLDEVLFEIGRRFPAIDVVQRVSNDYLDLFDSGIDIAVRAHQLELPSSALLQRRLGFSERWIVAAPAFLQGSAPISTPDDLAGRESISPLTSRPHTRWSLDGPGGQIVAEVRPILATNDFALMRSAVLAGRGLALLPAGMCARFVEQGTLSRVLGEWTAGGSSISLLIPERRGLLPSVRAVLDGIAELLPAKMRLA